MAGPQTFEEIGKTHDPELLWQLRRDQAHEAGEAAPGDVTLRDTLGRNVVITDVARGTISGFQKNAPKKKLGDMKAFVAAKAKTEVEYDTVDLQGVDFGDDATFISGVIAGAVVAEGMRPHAYRPGQWDTSVYQSATIDGQFSSMTWYAPESVASIIAPSEYRLYEAGADEAAGGGDDADSQAVVLDEGVTVDDAFLNTPGRKSPIAELIKEQRDNGLSYSLQLTAYVESAAGLQNLLDYLNDAATAQNNVPVTLPDGTLDYSSIVVFHGLRWAGIMQHEDSSLPIVDIRINPHEIKRYNANGTLAGSLTLQHNISMPDHPLRIAGVPDPATYIAGHPENTFETPPAEAIIIIDAFFDPVMKKWRVFATRQR